MTMSGKNKLINLLLGFNLLSAYDHKQIKGTNSCFMRISFFSICNNYVTLTILKYLYTKISQYISMLKRYRKLKLKDFIELILFSFYSLKFETNR